MAAINAQNLKYSIAKNAAFYFNFYLAVKVYNYMIIIVYNRQEIVFL